MTSIRKFVYAAFLTLTTLNFAPSLAQAQQPVRGEFTLAHDVRWQNAVVPAGDYGFSFESGSQAPVLFLSKLSGKRAGFMFLVPDTAEAKPGGINQLVLESAPGGSYVSAMQLPEFGMTLHFHAPSAAAETQMAKSAAGPAAAAQ